MSALIDDLIVFIEKSPTAWHTTRSVAEKLTDFTRLDEKSVWKLQKGRGYFVERNGSICAFVLPKSKPSHLTILGAHTDSPALKLKPNPTIQAHGFCQLGVEMYGGPLLSSWLNRDLGIAGRIVCKNSRGKIEEKLVFLTEAPLVIPQLPIHLDREVNEKGVILDKQEHLCPILSLDASQSLEKLLKKDTPLSFDLFLVPLEPPRRLGVKGEMLAAYRLDNLASSHAALSALISAKQSSALQMVFLWDAEEIGSDTAEGAASPFASDIFQRIQHFYNYSIDEWLALKASSLAISIDVAHAYNPNYPKKFDLHHLPLPGGGVVLKYHANKKYATDAKTAAPITLACHHLKLPYQSCASRSDLPSGSTIGPIFATKMGIPTVDIGSPLLSMHSIREVISCKDHEMLHTLLTHLLES